MRGIHRMSDWRKESRALGLVDLSFVERPVGDEFT